MRLPYLQLTQRFITTQSIFIASLLKTGRHAVIGMGTDLFAFTIEATSSDEKPPDGRFSDPDSVTVLEGAAGWAGEPGRMVDAFVRADVIERMDDGGLRVKGCDRYKATWEKNKRRSSRSGTGAPDEDEDEDEETRRRKRIGAR